MEARSSRCDGWKAHTPEGVEHDAGRISFEEFSCRIGYVAASGVAFVTGLLVGVGAGLLLAPQSGVRTRRQLRSLVEDVSEPAWCPVLDTREALGWVVECGNRLIA